MYWDPFEELERMHEEMDRLFERWFGSHRPLLGHRGGKHEIIPRSGFRAPVCHIQETESNIIATFELQGVSKGDIDLVVDDDHIEVKVESKIEKKHKDKESYSYTKAARSFYRRIPLPKEVNSSKATAEYKNGILRVEMPKKHKEEKKGRKVDIK
jgi:HSP20 family protein